jgi:cell division protein FtsW (lipid II flippase)
MKNNSAHPSKERLLLLTAATCLLLLLFARLYVNLSPGLEQAGKNYAEGRTLNLRTDINPDSLRKILVSGNYYTDDKDIDLITDSLPVKLRQEGALENLGAINKRAFNLAAPVLWKSPVGGVDFQSRLQASRLRLGFDSLLYVQELSNPAPLPSTVSLGSGPFSITGQVINPGENDQPVEKVLVQLKQHPALEQAEEDTELLTYARTNAQGRFSFTGLSRDSAYSVVPLKPGFEFGSRQGTADLKKSPDYTFKARPHQIRMIGPVVYSQLKEDKVFTVRTPEQFRKTYWMVAALFLLAFWLVHVFWSVRGFHPDAFLLPVLMLLTGISLLTLFSIQDPLQDTLFASQALQGVGLGLAGFALLSQWNFGKLYTYWWFDWLYNLRKRSFYNLQGWTWLTLAILLAVITLLAGTGPEGSGVKVNLQVGGLLFQPGEITKYLLLLFFAGFFAASEERIRHFSDLRWRFLTSWGVMTGTGIILVLYLLMGDMGPALVVCFTFLVFYSIARGNLLVTLATGIMYGILLWLLPDWLATIISLIAAIAFMLGQGAIKTSKWYGWTAVLVEAPVMLILIIAAFTFGDKLPGVGDRLADRKNMWLSQWNNDVYGGDHLAHSYWTLSSGGFSGQGLGKGFANTMPAAHTDMILPSIGEELGWMGVVAIFLLFGVLIHRIFLHARRAGQPFSFYLSAGIAIATGVQFLLIAGGSIGLLPLTGITVPFLSYGKISLMVNLTAMGIVAGISGRPGKEVQKEYIRQYYDPVLIAGICGFLLGVVALSVKLAKIQLWSGREYIVKPARVINRNGVPVYSYNPRIEKLTRQLAAGTIYDRNHLVLATSSADTVRKNLDSLHATGLDPAGLQQLMRKKQQRYYPFGEQMFFWTGDFNTRLFWGQGNGYFAEASHLSELRGFNTHPDKSTFITTRYRADRFTKPVQKSVTLASYDYSALAGMLQSGMDSKEAEALKEKNRDIRLSVDAALQVDIQNALSASDFKNKRISVVVLDAASGDVLASAIHPLPNLKAPEDMLLSGKEQSKLKYPVTDRDLGMTYPTAPGSTAKILTAMAAFNKLGPSADATTYKDITWEEIIRKGSRESEPFNEPVDMKKAIVRSSNVYFIRIANENNLDNEMANLYMATGMNVDFIGGYNFTPSLTNNEKGRVLRQWHDSTFIVNRQLYQHWRGKKRNRYNSEFSGLAWGQGKLTSTPAALARMAAAIANNGVLQPSRYILETGGQPQQIVAGDTIAKQADYASRLKEFMIEQSNPAGGKKKISISKVAGKTGTPERVIKKREQYDGWYVFFTPTPDGRSHTVVCVRIELGDASSNAVKLANEKIAPILQRRGYLGTF